MWVILRTEHYPDGSRESDNHSEHVDELSALRLCNDLNDDECMSLSSGRMLVFTVYFPEK